MTPKILIVDDEPNNLDVLRNCLRDAGFKVPVANSGKMALKRVNQIKPDLILLDIMMPEMDGFETCHRLKQNEATKDTPIIFITAKTDSVDTVKGLEIGAVDYITKPFRAAEVIARVNKHLTIHHLQKQLEIKNAQLQDQVYHLESLASLGKAIHEPQTIAQMMENVMKVTLSVFNCDRAWLLYPCDPKIPNWRVPIEIAKPEYPGANFLNLDIPMDSEISELMTIALSATGPIAFGPSYEYQVPAIAKQFSVQTQICFAIHPKIGKPWLFGIHQCSEPRVWTENEINLFRDFGHQISQSLGTLLSLEELQKREEQLKEAQQLAQLGSWELYPDNMTVKWSDQIFRLLGYEPGEIEPNVETYMNHIHPDDQKVVEKMLATVANKKSFPYHEYRLVKKDGSICYIEASSKRSCDHKGNITKIVGFLQDITKRKQTEIALKEAKEKADSANRAKSDFIANMSHEIRTPLNAILGYTQILNSDPTLSPPQQESIQIIERNGEHLLTLLNDILDLAKIEAGKIELDENNFDLANFVESVIKMVRIRADHKSIYFHEQPFNFSKQAPETLSMRVSGDEKRLRQILINLIGNAIKFTDKGGITLKVGPIGERFRFQVEDTGVGIAAEQLDQIFEQFHQVGDNNYKMQGTGLGLSISRRFVEAMGGQLNVTSQLGKGSVFWFDLSLPIVKNVNHDTISTEKQPIIGISGYKPTLLIVDDQLCNRRVFVHLLAPLGFNLIEAEDGEQAFTKALESKPDAIITDLLMPNKDGFELIQQIRQSADLKDKIVIVTSGSVFEADYPKSLAIGSNDFLAKPIQAEQLLEQLQRHLGIKWLYEGTPSEETPSEKMVLPSQNTLEMLFKLTLRGDVDALEQQADELIQTDEKFRPFAMKLRDLTQNLKIRQIRSWLKSYLES